MIDLGNEDDFTEGEFDVEFLKTKYKHIQKIPVDSFERPEPVCSCFPSHCDNFEHHGTCWCSPTFIAFNDGSIIFIHNSEN